LDVVDRIEDTVEATAYEDLIPLEVKLALENRIFGWSHLVSSILGHIFYTAGSFLLTYVIITELHYLYHMHLRKHDRDDAAHHADDMEAWFRSLRFAIAAFVAINTFRMVRRRRHVWFRAAYGSKEYQKDAPRRRMTVLDTDQHTLLGRLMRKSKELMQRRVQKKLLKAHKMFQKKQQRQQQRLKQERERLEKLQQKQQLSSSPDNDKNNMTTITTTTEDDDLLVLCDTPRDMCYSPCDSFCGNVDDVEPLQTGYSSDSLSSSDDEALVEAFLSSNMSDTSESQLNPDINRGLQTRKANRRKTFHTRPTTKMESIMHDQILFRCGPIVNMPYAHGGFFGAAPFMLAHPHWIAILRYLL
jgi:hypothetical protein